MEMENEMLNERYQRLHESSLNQGQSEPEREIRAVILKFDGAPDEKRKQEGENGFLFSGRMTLTQARILFVGIMAIITAGGILLIPPAAEIQKR